MILAEAIARIEERVPRSWAEEWDNPGLAVGDPGCDVARIALALDVTEDTVRQAADSGCQLLVSHHPIIFHAMRNLIFENPGPKAICLAVRNGISLYAAHTNWDSSAEGVNFCLADSLGLSGIDPLVLPKCDNGAWGLGAVGNFDYSAPVNLTGCMNLVKERWRLSSCSAFGDESRRVCRVAIGGGSCGDFWPDALSAGADVFITSDMPYHHKNDSLAMGLSLIIADHGEMERVSLAALKTLIAQETGLEVVLLTEKPVKRFII